MYFDWISYPATQYGVTGAGLLASLALWISARAQLRAIHHGLTKSIETLNSGMQDLKAKVEEMRTAGQTAIENAPAPSQSQAINLTKRAQVLRMRHRGESLNSIAAALQIPLGEVVLLLKIEKLLDTEPAESGR
jgi:hypothetical protein